MKRLVLPVICVLAVFFAACGSEDGTGGAAQKAQDEKAAAQNEKYVNQKFSFEISYPKDVLIGQGETPNGYGQTFESQSKDATLKSYAKFNTTDVPLETAYEKAQKGEVTDKEIDENASMFTVSGVDEGKAYTVRTYLLDDVYIVYDFTYPEDKKDLYGPIDKEMIESFNPF